MTDHVYILVGKVSLFSLLVVTMKSKWLVGHLPTGHYPAIGNLLMPVKLIGLFRT